MQQQIGLFSIIHCTTQGAKVSHDTKSHLHWESEVGQSDYLGSLGSATTNTCCYTTRGAKISQDAKPRLHWESVVGHSAYLGCLKVQQQIALFFYLLLHHTRSQGKPWCKVSSTLGKCNWPKWLLWPLGHCSNNSIIFLLVNAIGAGAKHNEVDLHSSNSRPYVIYS